LDSRSRCRRYNLASLLIHALSDNSSKADADADRTDGVGSCLTAKASRKMTNWRPIEEAPRDGRSLLLWARLKTHPPGSDDFYPIVGFWHHFIQEWKYRLNTCARAKRCFRRIGPRFPSGQARSKWSPQEWGMTLNVCPRTADANAALLLMGRGVLSSLYPEVPLACIERRRARGSESQNHSPYIPSSQNTNTRC
jgi:hypothetical protein